MKEGARRRLWWVLTIVAIAGVIAATALGIKRLRSNEMTGLNFVGPVVGESFAGPPGETYEQSRIRMRNEWLVSLKEPMRQEFERSSKSELYRFSYKPSFHPQVCVSAWGESGNYWIRTSVRETDPAENDYLWEKVKPLSIDRWQRIQAMFRKRTVIDPLNGKESELGLDGSQWGLESVVNGKWTFVEIFSPVGSNGIPPFTILRAGPGLEDFVETSLLLLDYGQVRVPEMY